MCLGKGTDNAKFYFDENTYVNVCIIIDNALLLDQRRV